MPTPRPFLREQAMALGGFALLTLGMFGDLLFSGGTTILGNQHTDLYLQFVGWRGFGFQELAKGNLALWNPHIFGGAPFFGGFQSALLYPPNALYLVLPLAQAINWSIALHVYLMGVFTYAWVKFRGLRLEAAFLAGVLMMFGGTYFLHVFAGHPTNLCTMVWAPLVFLAIDGMFAAADSGSLRRPAGWLLLGMFAVAMQILAGHPQYLFYTAIAAGFYSLIRLIHAERRGFLMLMLPAIYIGGSLLAAVQLMTGIQANTETIHGAPRTFEYAATFGFPPENFLTLLAPGVFGDMSLLHPYWGRWYLWEMSLFFGVTGFVCAVYGAVFCGKRLRLSFLAVIALLLVLALGKHTPLFPLLYDHVFGFDKFRSMSKFIFPASLFLVALAAHGFDRMLRLPRIEPRVVFGVFGLAGGLLLATLWVWMADGQAVVRAVFATGETYLQPSADTNPEFIASARAAASDSLLIAASTTVVLGLLLRRLGESAWIPRLILALAIIEMFFFARGERDTFDSTSVAPEPMKKFLAANPGDGRILSLLNPNMALTLGVQDLWGYDEGIVRRYSEFIAFTQGINPDDPPFNVSFHRLDPLYAVFRLRYAIVPYKGKIRIVELPNPMEHVQLISRYRLVRERDQIFAAMREPEFDPHSEVLLETPPQPVPVDSAPTGTARVVNFSTDWLEIEADTPQPAILLITDVYTPAWRAVALPGSSQSHYDLQPADYVLRAVPLVAGHHRLRVEYAPGAYRYGKWVSVISWLLFAAAAGVWFRMRNRSGAVTGDGHNQ
ncbi:MAG TPA: hypothetical protein VF480_05395 [Verrucomicrobiae bacterium]